MILCAVWGFMRGLGLVSGLGLVWAQGLRPYGCIFGRVVFFGLFWFVDDLGGWNGKGVF